MTGFLTGYPGEGYGCGCKMPASVGRRPRRLHMDLLWLAVIALVISLVAGALGFSGVARGAGTVAKVLFGIFLVLAIILFIMIALGISLFA